MHFSSSSKFRAGLVSALSLAAACSVMGAEFLVTPLGNVTPTAINASGLIVGNGSNGAFQHDGTNLTQLTVNATYFGTPAGGPPPQRYVLATASAINSLGQVAGSVLPVPAIPSTQTAVVTDGKGGGLLFSQSRTADAVNLQGQAAGGEGDAFFFDGTKVTSAGGDVPKLRALNDAGLAVGSVAPGFGLDRAATFDLGTGAPTVIDLASVIENLYGPRPVYQSTATAVNNAGQIVGTIRYAGGAPTPQPNPSFLVSGGNAINLGTLGGLKASAYAINNNAVVVGDSTLADGSQHAFVYRNGQMTDLNSLIATSGWVLTSARAINDRGQIAGVGTLNGSNSGFLLTPIDSGAVQPPSIATQPAGGTFELGASITLTASVTGTPPFGFEWQKDGKALTGPFTNSLVLKSLKGTDSGIYRLVVNNSAGKATSSEAVIQVLDPVLATALYTVVQVRGELGGKYQIEYKNQAEATAWQPLSTITLTQNPQLVLDPESVTNRYRIYRAARVP